MAPLPVTTTPIYKTVNTEKASIPKVDPPQNRVVHPVPPKPQLMVSQLKTKARSFQSPTLPKSSTRPAVDAEVNDVPKPIVVDQPPEERPPAHDIVSEKQAAPTISSLAPTTAVSATAVSLAEMTAVKERVVHTITFPAPILAPQPRPVETTTVALPTPLPTPQPRRTMGKPPSPPLPESIPTDAKSMREALRIVIMTRMLCDRQTREDRVEPVLRSNLSLEEPPADNRPSTTPQEVIDEVMQGPWHKARMETSDSMRGSLVERFRERQARLSEKVQQLREEYLSLHERWIAHCAQLDEQSKPPITESESASAAPSGRTTRRSTANNLLSDAVRSDLEMEQIIASLGNDDATDPNHLSLRNLATIPDMISVKRGRVDYTFDDTSHLVDDPKEYYGPHTGIHDWTDTEKEVFLDKFAAHPKQFGMIAEYLPNKTAAQCVDYYYLHKKRHIDFRKVILQYAPNKRKRRGTGKKKGNGLIADIRQHDAEVHGQQLDSPKTSGKRGRKPMHPPELKESRKLPLSRRRTYLDVTPSVGSATPTPEPESRRRGRRPAPVSRTVSVSLDDGEEDVADDSERPAKRAKRGRKVKSVAIINDNDEAGTPEPKLTEQTESISSWRKSGAMVTQWSEEDKSASKPVVDGVSSGLFLTLLSQHGDDFKRIAASMPNKTTIQVSNYYKTNAEDLALEKIAACAPKRSLTPDARKEIPLPPTPSSSAANCVPPPGTAATPTPTRAPAPVCTPVPTPPPAPAPDPMASLAPDSPHLQPSGSTSSSSPHVYERQEGEMASMRWSYDRPTINTSPPNVRGYQYPRPSSGAYPVPHHHPLSPNGYGPPISYGYPPYHYAPPHPHHAQYDPMGMGAGSRLGSMSHQHPYPMHEPARRMGVEMEQGQRARENPYPVLPPPGLPYHYSLEP
ncbi:hypothetical protein H0H81_002639 [Sphagnurus paluster]|uniref:SANT domain-containing protein n=1 Tax=Sphagnurus paluster TaxID=117069 RepID=A0A9P7KL89_9AGAR|nr:hypothetical protein H0H81_002639 [Sphagnurus paluster]